MLRRAGRFLEDRTGLRALLRSALDEEIGGGARWAYVFGSALGVLFVVQAVTGALLMLTYTPSVADAWSSVFYIQHRVTAGWFVRGLHSYGAQAMLLVAGLHLVQVVLYGAYKKPREVTWWLGLALSGLLVALVVTGHRLPWDQKGYWALLVELNVVAATPGVGDTLHDLAAGGSAIGRQTLTRLHALHVAILPAAVILLLLGHRALVRKHGRTAPEGAEPARSSPLYPAQVARDLLFVLLVLGAVAAVTAATHGVGLDGPAEPDRDYPARPEWFLRPLYELRKMTPGPWEVVSTIVVPGAVAAFLFALPLLDRGPSRRVRHRLVWITPVLLVLAGAGALGGISAARDRADEQLEEALSEQRRRTERAIDLARAGVPPEGPVAMLRDDPWTHGRDVYRQMCTSCHVLYGEGDREAPDHTGYGSRRWLMLLMHNPDDPHFFGETDLEEEMGSQDELGEEKLRGIVEFLFALGHEPQDPPYDEALAARGERDFERECMSCHTYGDDGDWLGNGGPHLSGYGSRTWIYRQIRDPGGPRSYGERNDMPAFHGQLTEHDLTMVTAYLRQQRFEEPDFTVEPPEDE